MNISPFMQLVARLKGLPPKLEGQTVAREEACDFCGSRQATLLGKMDFWDLSHHNLVECASCGLMQIDPMLSEADLSLGCEAFYRFEKREHGIDQVRRSCLRNFRKGVAFAMELRSLGVTPKRSLELGAGDAYFSRGLKYVFPELEVWCLDVVPEILREIERQHGFSTVGVSPESMSPENVGRFDLVIGRDILEHVRKPQIVMRNVHAILNPGGVFHFITPNGYEDVWFTYGFWRLYSKPVEHLINHVSFFPAATLKGKLEEIGFDLRRWILFDFKGTLREGKGKRIDPKMLPAPAQNRSAQGTIRSLASAPVGFSAVDPQSILSAAWLRNKTFAKMYCVHRHRPRWYCSGDVGVGHEIYGIAQKTSATE